MRTMIRCSVILLELLLVSRLLQPLPARADRYAGHTGPAEAAQQAGPPGAIPASFFGMTTVRPQDYPAVSIGALGKPAT